MYIRLKSEKDWLLKKEGIFLSTPNHQIEKVINTDNNLEFFNFIKFLEDFRTNDEIESYTYLTSEEKSDVLSYLDSNKYIQKSNDKLCLTRNDYFFNIFPGVESGSILSRIKEKRLIIVGLGTIGSYLVDLFSRIGFENIIIIDGDKVEEKNISAQLYYSSDIGNYKVDVLKQRFEEKVTAINKYISNFEDLKATVGGFSEDDIVINAADDYKLTLSLAESIVNKIFVGSLIVCGYGPLLVTAYLINNENKAKFLIEYVTQLLNERKKEERISRNSGICLNGFIGSFFVAKMIIDLFLEIDSEVASYNFVNNEFYLTSEMEE